MAAEEFGIKFGKCRDGSFRITNSAERCGWPFFPEIRENGLGGGLATLETANTSLFFLIR